MKARLVKFGEIEVEGKRYTHDVVIDGSKVRKRKKGPSKQFRENFGYSIALPTAFGSLCHGRPNGSASEIKWTPRPAPGALMFVSQIVPSRRGAAVERRDNFVHQRCMTFSRGTDALWCAARRVAAPLDAVRESCDRREF